MVSGGPAGIWLCQTRKSGNGQAEKDDIQLYRGARDALQPLRPD